MKSLYNSWKAVMFVLYITFTTVLLAQEQENFHTYRKYHDVKKSNDKITQTSLRSESPVLTSVQGVNWAFVDSMPDAVFLTSPEIKPFIYSPEKNRILTLSRNKINSDVYLSYNYSDNEGMSWNKCLSQVDGRYATCTFRDSGKIVESVCNLLFSLTAMKTTDTLMHCEPLTAQIQGSYRSVFTWSSDLGQQKTYVLLETFDSLIFSGAVQHSFSHNGTTLYAYWGHSQGNTLYIEKLVQSSSFPHNLSFMLTSSTDEGLTWTSWENFDWKSIPQLSAFDDFGTMDGRIAHDFVVDANGKAHIFFSVVDTDAVAPEDFKIVELYQTTNGWNGNIVATRFSSFHSGFGTLSQTDNELEACLSEDRNVIVVKWIDASSEGDTNGSDIFVRAKKINGDWGEIINVTNTNTGTRHRDMLTRLAPRCENISGNAITIYLTETRQLTNVPDDSLDYTKPVGIWFAKATIPVLPNTVAEQTGNKPAHIMLYNNYPNPFNPVTVLRYSISVNGNVSLKVFDMAGKEVATVFSGYQTAGKYEATFDASQFASGIYFCTLQAGNFSATEKMVLAK